MMPLPPPMSWTMPVQAYPMTMPMVPLPATLPPPMTFNPPSVPTYLTPSIPGWAYQAQWQPSWNQGAMDNPSLERGKALGIKAINEVAPPAKKWVNKLKDLFKTRQAVTYALHIRTFGAEDKNKDGVIDPDAGESGTFISAIKRLPELKALGVNNIHLLPILPVGELERLGEPDSPGSVYAPKHYDRLNDEYRDPRYKLSTLQQAQVFVKAAHKLGIHVMVDIPSCASVDLANERPDLVLKDNKGQPLTPTNWVDIRMFVKDTPALREYYQRFFDMMDKVGVDGYRADIARARSMEFWRFFIGQQPDKAWLAETYTEEDASPMKNIPRDKPEMLLENGFDAIYGQFHIFHSMNAVQYQRYLIENQALLSRVGTDKTIIGSFLTHDDPPTMEQGGAIYCKLISGLMATQPDTNPYILDGFTTGYDKHYDIFNWRPRPKGKHPDIGRFLKGMLDVRSSHEYAPVLTVGSYFPLSVNQNKRDPKIIAFLRQFGNKTLLVVANKDVNVAHQGTVEIPGLKSEQKLKNLAPHYGESSLFQANPNQLDIKYLGPGRFYLFDVDLPKYKT